MIRASPSRAGRPIVAKRKRCELIATQVVHCKKAAYDVYIGRPSKWGNPFTHIADRKTKAQFVVADRDAAIAAYRAWIVQQPELMAALHELQGKTLGCWCKPQSCHGDILAELADALL